MSLLGAGLGPLEMQMYVDLHRWKSDLDQAQAAASGMAGRVGQVFAALGAGLSVGVFTNWIKGAIDAADEANKMAQKLGIATDKVAGLQLAFEQSGAGGPEVMQKAMSKLSVELVNGNKTLDALGIKSKDSREALALLADKFQQMPDGIAKSSAAAGIFGERIGANMIPLLNAGRQGLDEMDKAARDLGITIDTETGKAAERFNDDMDLVRKGAQGAALAIGADLLPVMTVLFKEMAEASKNGGALAGVGDALSTGLEAVVVVGAEVAFMVRGIAREFSMLAGQARALAKLDFAEEARIYNAAKAEAQADRDRTDAFNRRILQARAVSESVRNAADLDEPRYKRAMEESNKAAAARALLLGQQAEAAKKTAAEMKKLADAENERLSRRGLAELKRFDEAAAEDARLTAEYKKAEQTEREIQAMQDMARQRRVDDAEAEAQKKYEAEVEAAKKANEQVLADWQRTVDQMGQSLADALMEGGKSVADYLKGLFRTLVLRPVLMPAATAFSSAISGPAAAATGGGAGGGDLLSSGASMLGSIGGALGTFGTGIGAGFASTMGGASLGTMFGASGAAISGGMAAGGSAGLGAMAGGLGSAIGALGPYALAAAAIYALYSKFKHERTPHTGGAAMGTSLGASGVNWADVTGAGPFKIDYSSEGTAGMSTLAQSIAALVQPVANLVGAGPVKVGAAFADDKSGDSAWGAFRVLAGDKELAGFGGSGTRKDFGDGEEGYKAFIQAVSDDTREAIDALDLPAWAQEIADTLGDGATLDQISAVVQSIVDMGAAIGQVRTLFDAMGEALPRIGGDDIAADLIKLAGGMDALAGGMNAYYKEFYTEAERTANATRLMAKSLAELGVDAMPATREEYRALVEAQDLATESGRETYVGLLQLAGAFAELVPAATAASEAVGLSADALRERASLETRILELQGDTAELRRRELEALDPANRALQETVWALEAAASVANERAGLETRLLQLQGDTAELRARELAALDPANRELQQLIYAMQDAATAAGAAAAAERQAASERARVANERAGLETRLLQLQGDTAALRKRELDALAPANRGILQEIYALEDKRLAEQQAAEAVRAAAAAAQEAARAAEQLRDAWKSLGETIADEVRRLRGLTDTAGGAGLQAQFAIATAQARAGDQAAAGLLPDLSRAITDLAEATATSAADFAFSKARTAASLDETLRAIAGFAGVPGFAEGGAHSGGLRLVGEAGPEIEYTGASQVLTLPQFADALGAEALRVEVRALRAEVARLREENNTGQAAIASAARKAARILETVTPDGDAIATREAAP